VRRQLRWSWIHAGDRNRNVPAERLLLEAQQLAEVNEVNLGDLVVATWHDAPVRPVEVEVKVLEIVEAVRRDAKVEDDLVECKWEWPETSKVRQFAALCNKARSDGRDAPGAAG
jgi:hypothetical protein